MQRVCPCVLSEVDAVYYKTALCRDARTREWGETAELQKGELKVLQRLLEPQATRLRAALPTLAANIEPAGSCAFCLLSVTLLSSWTSWTRRDGAPRYMATSNNVISTTMMYV